MRFDGGFMIYSSTVCGVIYCLHLYLSTVDPNPSTLSIDVSTTLGVVYTFYICELIILVQLMCSLEFMRKGRKSH